MLDNQIYDFEINHSDINVHISVIYFVGYGQALVRTVVARSSKPA